MVADKRRVDGGFFQILADELVQESGRCSWSTTVDVLFDTDGVKSGAGFFCVQACRAREFDLKSVWLKSNE